MMDDNSSNNIILSSGISLKEAFENEAHAYKINDKEIESLCYHSGNERRINRRMLEVRKRKGRLWMKII